MNKPKAFSVYHMTVLALMIAVTQTSRLLFSFIPNVQPLTVILILLTISFGTVDALIVGLGSIFLSNLTLGMGPWTLAQILSFSVIILLSKLLALSINKVRRPMFIWLIFSGATGILYGMIISIVQAPFYGMTIPSLLGYWLAGLWFDMYHAVGNIVFFLLLYPTLVPLLNKINKKIIKSQ
ncbi:hypothetical protein SAMN04488569_100657 [Marinilactibacillus piezotolerans]|uniref:Energy-coupling factor transport system substrate-specific component n=1 Tax=Marinilactibacillus piezotolerans TaxID=258723 RepID=A0A1I3W4B6_9LACT|nr:ECF transporter S component [Marinilactibacillus piezotolerans]SFK02282.1 hypothetical protein SAMN04488569_100657 [Marinilactibacillus piezotolerans]